jgi:hypothetical protein
MNMSNPVVGDTSSQSLQPTESEQSRSVQDQTIEELLQAPLNEESFERLLCILEERQRASLVGEMVLLEAVYQ